MRQVYPILFLCFIALLPPFVSHATEWSNQDVSTPEAIEAIDSYGESLVMAVGTFGAVYVSTDAGETWNTIELPAFGRIYDLQIVDEDSAFVVGQDLGSSSTTSGLIYKSTDGGSTWSEVLEALPFGSTIYDIDMYDATYGWASADSGAIYVTTDGGASWSLLDSGVSNDLYRTEFVTKLKGYAVGASGTIVKTTDGGATWSDISVGGSSPLWSVDFVSTTIGWVGGNGMFYKTINGGTTWTAQSINGVSDPVVFDIDANSTWIAVVTTADGVFETSDGGATWTEMDSLSSYWTSIYFPQVYHAYSSTSAWVGTNEGDIYWLEPVDTTGPSLSSLTPISATAGESAVFSITATDDSGVDVCTLYINGSNAGTMTDSGSDFSLSYVFSTAGSYAAYVICTDDVSNSTTGSTISVSVTEATTTDTAAPTDDVASPEIESTPPELDEEELIDPLQEADPGSLIKLPCEADVDVNDACKAVYFYSAYDGKRHAFPNEKVFFTWYENFDDVTIVGSQFMSSLALGSNITYHPGTRMVKFQTVHTVYAVTAGGQLRPIDSEETATDLYGDDWNQHIDDISDAFYGNYSFGDLINSQNDFDPTQEEEDTNTIDEDLAARE